MSYYRITRAGSFNDRMIPLRRRCSCSSAKVPGWIPELILQDTGLTLRELPAILLKNGFLFNAFPEYDFLLNYRTRPVKNGTKSLFFLVMSIALEYLDEC
jgi:hypothetical protein